MGRTVPTATGLPDEEFTRWEKFRRALRREDREILDWLFERARYHTAAAAYLSRHTPFDALVVAMLIEVVKLTRSSCQIGPPPGRITPQEALPPGPAEEGER